MVLIEVEATVNARPLVYVGDDLESNITLTPNHFLSLNPKTGISELEMTKMIQITIHLKVHGKDFYRYGKRVKDYCNLFGKYGVTVTF